MASETSSGTGDEASEDGGGRDGVLFSLYERYIGEPESERVVYVGFGLFFGGIALGLFGLVLFLYSGMQPAESDFFWQLRETALAFALLAMPATILSIVVLLSFGRRTLGASVAGTVLCVAATVWMTQVYPYQWTAAGNDIRVITTYSAGLVLLAASTGSALVAQYVDRASPAEGETATDDGEEDVSDEEVAEDIEEAMSETTLTWGGVEQQPETKRLSFEMPDPDQEIDGADVTPATETRSSGENVDSAVSDLRRLQGGDQQTARSTSPDDQVDSLTELRRQKEQEELETGVDTDHGLLAWLRRKLFG